MSDLVLVLGVAAAALLVGLAIGILIARAVTRRMDEPDEEAGS